MSVKEETKRRDKLAVRLAALEERRGKLMAELQGVTAAWESALEAGTDTTRHANKRRALTLDLEDLDAEAARVGGWVAEIDAQIAAAEEHARREQQFAEESRMYAADVDRLAGLRMDNAAWRQIAIEVHEIAQRATSRTRETIRITEELPARNERLRVLADQLGVDWSPPPLPENAAPDTDQALMSVQLGRACFAAARGDVSATAKELGEAAGLESGA